jgi:hypothetical protein
MNICQLEQKLHQHTDNKQVDAMRHTHGAAQHFRGVYTALDHGRRIGNLFLFRHNNRVSGIDGARDRCRV